MKTHVADTSLAAYENIKPDLNARQGYVYNGLRYSATDMTNNELAHKLDMPINEVTPRVFELREKGYVRTTGKRPCRVTGKTCYAWVVNYEEEKQGELF